MGAKDSTEKVLEAFDDVFADIMNALIFGGRRVVKESDLQDAQPFSYYKADGRIRGQERDVGKKWKSSNIELLSLGLENMSAYEKQMVLRVISYDGADYRNQIPPRRNPVEGKDGGDKSGENGLRFHPVITIVLNFSNTRWPENAKRLSGVLDMSEENWDAIEPWFSDYKINVVDVAFLTNEQIAMFKSDFRFIAELFVKQRTRTERTIGAGKIEHKREVLDLLSAVTGDTRFLETETIGNGESEEMNMRSMIDDWLDEGRAEGRVEGRAEGEERGLDKMLRRTVEKLMTKSDMTENQALDFLDVTEEERRRFYK